MAQLPITLKLFISSILFLGLFISQRAFGQGNEGIMNSRQSNADLSDNVKPKEKHFQYFRVGVDVSKIIRSSLTDKYSTAEILLESNWKENFHYVIETGFATSNTHGDNISFKSLSYFARVGFDKYFFGSLYKGDMDNAFVGLRLGSAIHNRGDAIATVWDPFYGSTTITKNANTQLLYWVGLTAGFRLELYKNLFVGWNVRGKTFINLKKIEELTPTYLAGYGAAKKLPAFDYNLYLLFGFGKR